MSSGSLEITLVSASISPYITFENEPSDTYAILRCTNEQHCTKNARDQGRLPVWNETFKFDLQERDMSNELLIQVFNVRTEVDELLGLARIPIHAMVGREEASLCALISPTQREIGKLKAAWKWKPVSQISLKASSFQRKASEVQDYTGKESCTSEPFDPDQPYRSLKATSYEGKASGMQGYADYERYTAGTAYDSKVPPCGGGSGMVAYHHAGAGAEAAYDSKVPPYGGDSGMVAYPQALNPNNMSSEPFSKLDAVSDALAKLAVDKEGSGRSLSSAPSHLGDSRKSGTEGGDYYHEPSAPPFGAYPTESSGHAGYPDIRASDERKGDFGAYSPSEVFARGLSDQYYPPRPTDTFPSHKDGYPPHPGTTYPPPPDAFPPNKDTYPPHSGAAYPPPPPKGKDGYPPYPGSQYPPPSSDSFPQSKDGYPPYPGSTYPPPPPSGAYQSSSGAYPPNTEAYPPYPSTTYPPYPDHQSTSSSEVHGEGFSYMEKGGGSKEKGGGSKEKGGSKKEKDKGHGSHAPYGQPPPAGYPYAPAPHGYPPAPQGYPPAPHGYPPAPQGYPPAPQGYPPAPHGYPPGPPPAPHGYPPAPQGYPPYGYPSANQHSVAAPYGYPSPAHGSHSGHYPEKHGHGMGQVAAAGAYIGHSSSSSKPSKKHKDPKHSSHKHDKHKKQKSFKGLKFKKFKF